MFVSESDPFRFGLERMLDGVAVHIDTVAAQRPAPAGTWETREAPAVVADRRYRETQKATREAERALRAAQKGERQALREARERAAHAAS